MNKVIIRGRLANDATVKETAAGKVVAFTLADNLYINNERVKDENGKDVVQYVDCAVRGNAVEKAETLKKGNFVNAEAYLQVKRTNKDGKYYTNVTVWINRFHEKAADDAAKADAAVAEA